MAESGPLRGPAVRETLGLRVWESEGGHVAQQSPGALRWLPAGALTGLADDSATHADLAGRPVCLVRSGAAVYALLDECSHGQVALSDGDVDGRFVECWLHGSRFDLATGRPAGPPATAAVPVYPVRIRAGVVEVGVPDDVGPAAATPGRWP